MGTARVRVQRETDSGHLQENSASKLSWYNFQNTRSNSGLVEGTLSLDLLSSFHLMSAMLYFIKFLLTLGEFHMVQFDHIIPNSSHTHSLCLLPSCHPDWVPSPHPPKSSLVCDAQQLWGAGICLECGQSTSGHVIEQNQLSQQ